MILDLSMPTPLRRDWDELFVCLWSTWNLQLTEERRETWRQWARRHTVDPNTIVVPGWIAVFRADRQIHYASDPLFGLPSVVVVQLEAEPSGFPR